MKNMFKKRWFMITVVVLVLLLTLGLSYAFFHYVGIGNSENSVKAGDIRFHYAEGTGVGNGISIEDGEALLDSEGKVLEDYFEFSIDGNLMNRDLTYEIVVEPTADSNINLEGIKFYLTEVVSDTEVEISQSINNSNKVKTLSEYDNTDITGQTGKVVYLERIPANTKNYVKIFRARMWISEDVDPMSTGYFGKTGSFRINAYTNNGLLLDAVNLTYQSKVNPDTNELYTSCTNVKCALDELYDILDE